MLFQRDPRKSQKSLLAQYLSNLSTKGIFELANELAEEGLLEINGMALAPPLKSRWQAEVPLDQICEMILDGSYDPKFRAFLIDVTPKVAALALQERTQIQKAILAVAQDETDHPNLRRYALLQLRKPLRLQESSETEQVPSPQEDDSTANSLSTIFNDPNSPPGLKGASLTAMRRAEDPAFAQAVSQVLAAPKDHPDIVVRHAVVSAAKSSHPEEFLPHIREITTTTDNPEVYGSSVYALGLIGNRDAVLALVLAFGRHGNERTGTNALRKNYQTILSMLDPDQRQDHLRAAIAAAQLIGLPGSREKLEILADSELSPELRRQASEALSNLNDEEISLTRELLKKLEDE
ncbi:MAG: hypothetical protein GY835_23295 [bacterium]|nr:hypothetical protein [bacterium]